MKTIKGRSGILAIPLIAFLLVMVPATAMASSAEWRPTYDLVMMWVNFIIFAAVIFKYGRAPIKSFLNQQKGDVASELDAVEAEKARIVGEIESANAHVAENEARLKEMKARLIAQGEVRKQQIVEQARQQSAIMMEETRKKMETRIFQAKEKLKMELADMAFEQAVQRLPQIITDSDNQRLLDNYMQGLHLEEDAVG
jgi:F-type H+-transporting ATPase subunit b